MPGRDKADYIKVKPGPRSPEEQALAEKLNKINWGRNNKERGAR